MGNCSSSAAMQQHAVAEVADSPLITVVRSTDGKLLSYPAPVFVKDLMAVFGGFAVFSFNQPLHPDTQLALNTSYHLKPLQPQPPEVDPQPPEAPPPATGKAPSGKPPRSPKKVRFAEEPVVVSSHSNRSDEGDAVPRDSSSNGSLAPQAFPDRLPLDHGCVTSCRPACTVAGGDELPSTRALNQRGDLKGAVRLKVVISRKDLTELMSPKTPQSRAEAMAERIIGPLLLPQQAAGTDSPLSS